MEKRFIMILSWSILHLSLMILPLLGSSQNQPSIPEAKYEVRLERSVMVPMRDGVKLSTDLYFPVGAGEKLPVILLRTPYNKKIWRAGEPGPRYAAYMFSSQGYIVAVQDCRGKFESEGEYRISATEASDGYDSVTWASKQPWSNGNVGKYVCSYMGEVQIMQAKLRHPNLKAMIPQAAGGALGSAGDRYRYWGFIDGGTFQLCQGAHWFFRAGSKVYFRPPPHISQSDFLEIA